MTPDPDVLDAAYALYASPHARVEDHAAIPQSRLLSTLRHAAAGLNLLLCLVTAALLLLLDRSEDADVVPVLMFYGIVPLLNVLALWPCRSHEWMSVCAAICNLVWALFFLAWVLLIGGSSACVLTALLVGPQMLALAVQGVALGPLLRGRF